jgi:predicted acylesterase/phospholipase RssA
MLLPRAIRAGARGASRARWCSNQQSKPPDPRAPPNELARAAHTLSRTPHELTGNVALSFGGSGLMLIYQAGVASAFHGCPAFMQRVVRVLGTSGGACVGVMLLACPERIEEALEYYCSGALFRGATIADVVDPTMRLLPRFVEETNLLPADAYERLAGGDGRPAFTAHVTPVRLPFANIAIRDFASNAELVDAVRASCCLHPRGVMVRGERYFDGGLSDSLPLCEDASMDTVTVSPFGGPGIDVAPGLAEADAPHTVASRAALAHQRHSERQTSPRRIGAWLRYNPSFANAQSLLDATFPRGRQIAETRYADGQRDGRAFLKSLGYELSVR